MRPGLHYTFHLRSNAKFQAGAACHGGQVRASFLRALDSTLTSGRAWPIFPIRGALTYSAGDTTARGSRGPERFDSPHLFLCLVFLLVNLLTDLLYAKADPFE